MRKTYPLEVEGRDPQRVVEAIKYDIKKYMRRERRKALPKGVDYWDFECRVGRSSEAAEGAHVGDLNREIDRASTEAWGTVYVELISKPGRRGAKGGAPPESGV